MRKDRGAKGTTEVVDAFNPENHELFLPGVFFGVHGIIRQENDSRNHHRKMI